MSLECSLPLLRHGKGRLLRWSSRVALLAVAQKAICKVFLVFVLLAIFPWPEARLRTTIDPRHHPQE